MIKILEFSDIIDGLESLEYENMTLIPALQELCKGRALPHTPGSVPALRKKLELNDMVMKLKNHEEEYSSEISEVVMTIDNATQLYTDES